MPNSVLEAYVVRLSETETQRRYDAAVAATVPHWESESRSEYLKSLGSILDKARSRVGQAFESGKEVYDDFMGWLRGLGFGEGSGVDGD